MKVGVGNEAGTTHHIHTYVYMIYVRTYVCISTYVCICLYPNICMYIYTHTYHIHIHITDMYTYTGTHSNTPWRRFLFSVLYSFLLSLVYLISFVCSSLRFSPLFFFLSSFLPSSLVSFSLFLLPSCNRFPLTFLISRVFGFPGLAFLFFYFRPAVWNYTVGNDLNGTDALQSATSACPQEYKVCVCMCMVTAHVSAWWDVRVYVCVCVCVSGCVIMNSLYLSHGWGMSMTLTSNLPHVKGMTPTS